MTLMGAISFGCGRLAGGASSAGSQRLLATALDAGVAALDVAPSYGLGLAEQVVGGIVQDYPQVRITTKVGQPVPRFGHAKSLARMAKRTLQGSSPRSLDGYRPLQPPRAYGTGEFTTRSMVRSLHRSVQRLGRIDRALLHDCAPAEIGEDALSAYSAACAELGIQPGYAFQAIWNEETGGAFPADFAGQAALDPDWLIAAPQGRPARPITFHSLLQAASWNASRDSSFAGRWDKAARVIGMADGPARIAAILAHVHVRFPDSGLIISSTNQTRLENLLAAIRRVDKERLLGEVSAVFG